VLAPVKVLASIAAPMEDAVLEAAELELLLATELLDEELATLEEEELATLEELELATELLDEDEPEPAS
jgi:hypothetical protein